MIDVKPNDIVFAYFGEDNGDPVIVRVLSRIGKYYGEHTVYDVIELIGDCEGAKYSLTTHAMQRKIHSIEVH